MESDLSISEASRTCEQRILRALRRIIRAVDIYSHRLAIDFGVTGPQLSCLLRVVEAGPLTLTSLAKEVDLSPSTLVGVIDRLEKKGLVKRERRQADRRQVLISATEKGQDLASGSPSPLQSRLARALDSLAELERVAIAQSLERIVDLMEIGQVDASPIFDAVDLPKPESEALGGDRLRELSIEESILRLRPAHE